MNDQPQSTFARRVRAARARARKYEIRDDIAIGLGLTIQPAGVRTFFPDYVPSSSALRTRNAIVLENSSETENRRPSGRKTGCGAA